MLVEGINKTKKFLNHWIIFSKFLFLNFISLHVKASVRVKKLTLQLWVKIVLFGCLGFKLKASFVECVDFCDEIKGFSFKIFWVYKFSKFYFTVSPFFWLKIKCGCWGGLLARRQNNSKQTSKQKKPLWLSTVSELCEACFSPMPNDAH